MQRISSQVAGSIFSDLISGAFRPGDSGPPPASERAINELPCCPVPKTGAQCSVCLLNIDADATSMPCGHLHHKACLSRWLRSHNTCPVCRTTIEADETPQPNHLHALLQGWREARRAAEGNSEGGTGSGREAPSASSSMGGSGTAPSISGSISFGDRSTNGVWQTFGDMFHGSSATSGQPRVPPPSPPLTEAELLALSVPELKSRLHRLGVDTSGIVEKRELQDLLRERSGDASEQPQEQQQEQQQQPYQVQVHMEVVQLPGFTGGVSGLQAAMQAVAQRAEAAAQAAAAPPVAAPAPAAAGRPSPRLLGRGHRSPRNQVASFFRSSSPAANNAAGPAASAPEAQSMARSPAAAATTATAPHEAEAPAATASSRRRRREDSSPSDAAPEQRRTRARTRSQQ